MVSELDRNPVERISREVNDSNAPETMSDGSFTEGVFSGKAEEPPKYPFAHQIIWRSQLLKLSEFSEQIESTQMLVSIS